MKTFWTLFLLQFVLVLAGAALASVLGAAGVPRGAAIAAGAAVAIPAFLFVVYRLKRREDEKVAAMGPSEAKRYELRHMRIGLIGGILAIVVFGTVSISAQTPQAFFMLALYVLFVLFLLRRLRSARADRRS